MASLSACWAAIRASQWLGKLLLFPNQGDRQKSGHGTSVDHQPPSNTCAYLYYLCILYTHDDSLLCSFITIIVIILLFIIMNAIRIHGCEVLYVFRGYCFTLKTHSLSFILGVFDGGLICHINPPLVPSWKIYLEERSCSCVSP